MRATRGAAALFAAVALALLPALPATAHDELTAVTPEPGSVLTTAPEQVRLSFSGEVMEIGHEVAVTDSSGRSVTEGPLETRGNDVVQPLADTGDSAESYHVVWRVVSGDGHPIEGTFRYDVGAGAEPDPDSTTPAGDPAERTGDPASEAASGDVPLWLVAVLGGVAAVALLAAVSVVSRRRRGH
ncbi:copper resistance protein CopC [Kocuria sp. M1R5S2]|uniref:copper resistance CopC family protein n=1 Tax=Kocuria rhizosphaerae TaxID=3376285 RepID=UPI0037AEBBEB